MDVQLNANKNSGGSNLLQMSPSSDYRPFENKFQGFYFQTRRQTISFKGVQMSWVEANPNPYQSSYQNLLIYMSY